MDLARDPSCGSIDDDEKVRLKIMANGSCPTQLSLCRDGVYRWFYSYSMLKNPVILFTVWAVEAISFGAVYVFLLVIGLIDGSLRDLENFLNLTKGFLILLFVFLLIGAVAYLIVAASYGGHYLVLFEMNDIGIRHIQMPSQFDQAQALSWIAMMAGRTPGAVGAGMLSGIKSESYVRFAAVRRVRVQRRFHTIKVNELLEHSQVYAAPQDFDFVLNFILARVPGKRRQ